MQIWQTINPYEINFVEFVPRSTISRDLDKRGTNSISHQNIAIK